MKLSLNSSFGVSQLKLKLPGTGIWIVLERLLLVRSSNDVTLTKVIYPILAFFCNRLPPPYHNNEVFELTNIQTIVYNTYHYSLHWEYGCVSQELTIWSVGSVFTTALILRLYTTILKSDMFQKISENSAIFIYVIWLVRPSYSFVNLWQIWLFYSVFRKPWQSHHWPISKPVGLSSFISLKKYFYKRSIQSNHINKNAHAVTKI